MANSQSIAFPAALGQSLRPFLLLLGIAAAVAAGVTVVLWWRGPSWSLLYGSLSDSDTSSVMQALQASGIEYKVDDASGAIMVPAERVRDTRLKLAAQGLPEGKTNGMDLINKDQGFGVSQFMENARYQYALENELANTIASLQAVQAARVHLALPQQSAFVHDQRPASASVLLQLRAGNHLEQEQISAITHLVASSIPDLNSDQVTVVDQEGHLLSSPKNSALAAANEQFDAERRIEQSYAQNIETLLTPLVGEGRVRAQVTVGLDAGDSEQAAEQYQPNSAVVRSEQTSEATNRGSDAAGGGVPGSLTNQPPTGGTATPVSNTAASAPAVKSAAPSGGKGAAVASTTAAAAVVSQPESTTQESTRNYEIDRTLSYTRQPAGRIKRITAAVLIDDASPAVAPAGAKVAKPVVQSLSAAQLADITNLVKNAVGFDPARGDSVSVVTAPFLEQQVVNLAPPVTPLWQRPWLRDAVRLTLGALVLIALALGVLRPLIKGLAPAAQLAAALSAPAAGSVLLEERPQMQPAATQSLAYEQQIVQARGLVAQDPKRVAQVVKTWVSEA